MDEPFILLLSGPPGAGKTTVSTLIGQRFARSAVLHADWFWTTLVSESLPPWQEAANDQNEAMLRAALAATARIAAAGYVTVLEGILGPWFFDLVTDELGGLGLPVYYAMLLPDLATCLERADSRRNEPQHRDALNDEEPIRTMHEQFARSVDSQMCVLGDSGVNAEEMASAVLYRLERMAPLIPG